MEATKYSETKIGPAKIGEIIAIGKERREATVTASRVERVVDGLSQCLPIDDGWARIVEYEWSESEEETIGRKEKAEKRYFLLESCKNVFSSVGKRSSETVDLRGYPKHLIVDEDQIPYGGGEWYVITETAIWQVRNNGADGDNWGCNNIITSGAGAIGTYIELPEYDHIKEKIETL